MNWKAMLLAAVAGLSAATADAADDGIKVAARGALASQAGSVVTLKFTAKARFLMQGREMSATETTYEVGGTILSPSGLTVTSELASNPFAIFELMAGQEGMKVETEISSVKLLLADGQEVPAKIVLRDRDLDLVFAAPVESGLHLPSVSLEKGAFPAPLDELAVIERLGMHLGRAPAVVLARVRGVVKKPRTIAALDVNDAWHAMGSPALDDKGRFVGVVVFRRATPDGGGGPFAAITQAANLMVPVLLGSGDVLDVMAQIKPTATTSAP